MYIEHIEVEGGFLDGLNLNLRPGLNVLIGARGTGKTSLIELIRFALDAPSFTEQARLRSHQHALAVLANGRITLYLRRGDELLTVSRTQGDARPRSTAVYSPITVLAQNEIEAVGNAPEGRLRLIDMFIPEAELLFDADEILSDLSSQTAEIQGLLNEISALEDQLLELSDVPDLLKEALTEQQNLFSNAEASQRDQALLRQLQAKGAQFSVRLELFGRTKKTIETASGRMRMAHSSLPIIENWPTAAGGEDQMVRVRQLIGAAAQSLRMVSQSLAEAISLITDLEQAASTDRIRNDESARPLRQKLEQLQAGAGALAQRVEALREREGQLSALAQAISISRERLQSLIARRRSTFESLESLRSTRLARRQETTAWLNRELRPTIKASVLGSGQMQPYTFAIAEALQGSGLHYNSLAPLISSKMSPLEFVEAIESDDVATVVSATGISPDRVGAICSYLAGKDLTHLVMCRIEDSVSLSLLDGKEFKDSTELSIGQRCTVVLPILLSRHRDVLIVDQPEDHLDNAFVTNTLVPGLLRRKSDEQLIFSSHNANIPVLGNADNVILMDSDGRRGFVRHSGEIDDPLTVDAVTDVMEGGKEAFERRASFYRRVYDTRDG